MLLDEIIDRMSDCRDRWNRREIDFKSYAQELQNFILFCMDHDIEHQGESNAERIDSFFSEGKAIFLGEYSPRDLSEAKAYLEFLKDCRQKGVGDVFAYDNALHYLSDQFLRTHGYAKRPQTAHSSISDDLREEERQIVEELIHESYRQHRYRKENPDWWIPGIINPFYEKDQSPGDVRRGISQKQFIEIIQTNASIQKRLSRCRCESDIINLLEELLELHRPIRSSMRQYTESLEEMKKEFVRCKANGDVFNLDYYERQAARAADVVAKCQRIPESQRGDLKAMLWKYQVLQRFWTKAAEGSIAYQWKPKEITAFCEMERWKDMIKTLLKTSGALQADTDPELDKALTDLWSASYRDAIIKVSRREAGNFSVQWTWSNSINTLFYLLNRLSLIEASASYLPWIHLALTLCLYGYQQIRTSSRIDVKELMTSDDIPCGIDRSQFQHLLKQLGSADAVIKQIKDTVSDYECAVRREETFHGRAAWHGLVHAGLTYAGEQWLTSLYIKGRWLGWVNFFRHPVQRMGVRSLIEPHLDIRSPTESKEKK